MSHAPHHGISDEKRVPGDIIGHILIGGWLISVGICLIVQGCNSKLLSSLRHSRRFLLFPSISGITFWASLGLFQLYAAINKGLMRPEWLEHIEMTSILSFSFLIQYFQATGVLTETFWVVAEPVAALLIAVTFGFMHTQHSYADIAYHGIIAYGLIVLAFVRLATLWSAAAACSEKSNSAPSAGLVSDLNPIFLPSTSRASPLPFLGGYLYVLCGVFMMDIAFTPYLRPHLVKEMDLAALYHFAERRIIRCMICIFFFLALARLAMYYWERRQRRRSDSGEVLAV